MEKRNITVIFALLLFIAFYRVFVKKDAISERYEIGLIAMLIESYI